MSAQTEAARTEFDEAMVDAQNLIDIHRSLNQGRGRRFREVTINRAIVVLSVAAWQALIEDLAEAILDTIEPAVADPTRPAWVLVNALTRGAIGRYNTPDVLNTRSLLANVGFDPQPSWSWGFGNGASTPAAVARRIDEWLRVRHSIAHGGDLPQVGVISRTAGGALALRLADAEECRDVFVRAAHASAAAAHAQFP
jgi:hypothetical protein